MPGISASLPWPPLTDEPSFGTARLHDGKSRWPLMLFSHGLGGSPISGDHIEVLKLFASQGYVVAAPFHGDGRIVDVRLEDGNDLLVAILNFPKYIAMQALRAQELAATADYMLTIDAGFKDRVDRPEKRPIQHVDHYQDQRDVDQKRAVRK